ncbi:MAG: hypothetical protein ABFD83_05475 [Armatimonadota bacterium]
MSRDIKDRDDSAVVLMVQVLAIILVFAVPTIVLTLALPKYSSWIVLGGIYLLFATAALFAGVGWRDPNYTLRAKIYTLLVLAATIFYVPTSRLISDFDWEFTDFVNAVSIRSACLLSPFIIGLILSRVMRKYTTPSGK